MNGATLLSNYCPAVLANSSKETDPPSEHKMTEKTMESVYIFRPPSPCHACAQRQQSNVLVDLNEKSKLSEQERSMDIAHQKDRLYTEQLEEEIQADRLDHRAIREALAYEKSQHHETTQQLEYLQSLLERTDQVFRAIRLQRRTTSADDRPLSEIVDEALNAFDARGDNSMAIIRHERDKLWRQKFLLLADWSTTIDEREKAVLQRETLLASQEAWQEFLTGNINAVRDLARTMALHQSFRDSETLPPRGSWTTGERNVRG